MSLWTADNYTPFAIGRAFVRDREGRETWVVATRGTFSIRSDGSIMVAEQQEPVSRVPRYLGDSATSGLLFDSDFVFSKLATDVVVVGEAWASRGRPVSSVDVQLRVADVRKTLRVHGERRWRRSGAGAKLTLDRAEPFVHMPITYERAWGGRDPEGENSSWPLNPIGRGFARRAEALIHTAAPNIENPREPVTEAAMAPSAPAGFGALSPNWAQRLKYAGTYDERWQQERAPLWPEDFDHRFFQISSEDQRSSGFLKGGEPCELHNMTSDVETLRFHLPRITINTTTHFRDRIESRPADLHLVVLEPEERRLQLVWHAAIECHGREHLLQRTRIKHEGEKLCLSQSTPTA